MKRISIVQGALDDIGWGSYHSLLFINCGLGFLTALMWTSTISLVMSENQSLSTFQISVVGTLANLGTLLGCILFPLLSDRFGRGFVFTKIIFVTIGGGLVLVFSNGELMIYASSLLIGLGIGGDLAVPASVMLESTPTKYRPKLALMNLGFCIGPLVSQFTILLIELYWTVDVENWRMLVAVTTAITTIIGVLRSFTTESPMFLYGTRDSEFLQVIIAIARNRGRTSYDTKAQLLLKEPTYKPELESASVFKSPYIGTLVRLTVCISLLNFGFTGVLYFLPSFLHIEDSSEKFTVLIVQQFAGAVGMIFTMIMGMAGTPLKTVMSVGLIIGGAIAFPLIYSDGFLSILVFSAVLYFGLMIGISCKNVIIPASFPAQCRGMGVGVVMAASRITAIVVPALMGVMYSAGGFLLPIGLLGTSMLLAGIACYFLKSTN